MAQVGAAVSAMHLGALHPKHTVDFGANGVGRNRLKVAGPTGTRVEFGRSIKQRLVAADAAGGAGGVLLGQAPAEGALGGLVARDQVGQWLGAFVFELGLPLGVGLADFVSLGCLGW